MMSSKCALCGRQGAIRQSHIIPKFATKWIKRTSTTGLLAGPNDGAKRVQDGAKIRLLCDGCEGLFAKPEKYFADKVFYPFHNRSVRSFDYDDNLGLFAVLASWRALKTAHGDITRNRPQLAGAIGATEACWREVLLGKRRSITPYKSHLLFIDSKSIFVGVYEGRWYTARGVDSSLAASRDAAFSYSLLPLMAVVTSIRPAAMVGWQETSIEPSGRITAGQRVVDPRFWGFVEGRASDAVARSPGPSYGEGRRRLQKALEKDPSRVRESDTMKLITEELGVKWGTQAGGA